MPDKDYRVKINNVERLRSMLQLLAETAHEIDTTNPHQSPIQFHVKQRWGDACHMALGYFSQFLLQKEHTDVSSSS